MRLPLTDRVIRDRRATKAIRRSDTGAGGNGVAAAARGRQAARCPASWLFTDEALQQASAAAVASHRAQRLAGRIVHDVTCSIGTEVAALRGCGGPGGGQRHRPGAAGDGAAQPGAAADLCRADALHPVTRDAVVMADPARRGSGRRRFNPREYQPALDQLFDVYRGRELVVKCAPGIDFDVGDAPRLRRRDRGDLLSGVGAGSVLVVGRVWPSGCAPAGQHPGPRRSRSPTPSRTIARCGLSAGGSSTPTARWCGPVWCAITLRGTGCGSWTRTSPTCPGTNCPRGYAGSRFSSSCRSTSDGCVRRSQRWTAARWRSWCAAWTSTPRRYDGGWRCGGARP